MKGVSRTVKWAVKDPGDYACLKSVPKDLLKRMETLPIARHAHDAVITNEDFQRNKVMTNFFTVVGLDDALTQGMPEDDVKDMKEFPKIIQAKNFPISSWFIHPESLFSIFWRDTPSE